jgi:site-specific recombinase XerC
VRALRDAQDDARANPGSVYVDLGLVVANPDGMPWGPDSLTVRLRRLATQANVVQRFHDPQHSFATLLLADSAGVREVSELLRGLVQDRHIIDLRAQHEGVRAVSRQ